ncbi:hypothetical protein CDL12_03993 [Handroanthus impetiginosus]|uniref:Uncharacterized protein n=1 Tax=Handroanthus impetiginosus TaxID=429701 RepID=A0A2G9I0L7_9LAMI|nr:hypothetical protein CDL12_03993 [Handroanthus impetiginosus]
MDSESILEELNLKHKELRSLNESLEKNFQYLKANADQLAAWYVIFGCIMHVEVLSAQLRGNRWIPVGVVASVSIAFWLTFTITVKDCLRVRQQQDLSFMEQEKLYRKIFSIQTGRCQDDGSGRQSLANAFTAKRFQRYSYVGAIYAALFSFTFLVLYGLSSVHRRW